MECVRVGIVPELLQRRLHVLVRLHWEQQRGAVRVLHHLAGHAAHEEALESGVSALAEHDQVDVHLVGVIQDHGGRVTLLDGRAHRLGDLRRRQAELRRLLAIDVDLHLGAARVEVVGDVDEAVAAASARVSVTK